MSFMDTLKATAVHVALAGVVVYLAKEAVKSKKQHKGMAELHLHLDGSLRPDTLMELLEDAAEAGDAVAKRNYFSDLKECRSKMCWKAGMDLPTCLQSFEITLCVLQSAENLERVAFEICEDLVADGVTYAEIRYCPSLHRNKGLKDDEIVTAVYDGITRASSKYPKCQFFQILTALRDLGPDEATSIVRLAIASGKNKGVVGVDLAGNEAAHPPELFEKAFSLAHADGNLGITIHAGEGNTDQNIQNVKTSVEVLHATRIGHGVAAGLSKEVQTYLKEKGVTIETCPTSNTHTCPHLKGSLVAHPALALHQNGVLLAPATDNSLMSSTCTSAEYRRLRTECGFSAEDLEDVRGNAHNAGFVSH